MSNKKYTDEELLEILKRVFEENPKANRDTFKVSNGLPNESVYRYRFGSFKNAKELVGIKCREYYGTKERLYSDEELLNLLKEFNDEIGFPTAREFDKRDDLPHGKIYYERFGSFKNALELAEIEIPENKQKLFQRNNDYTHEDIKDEFDILVDLYLTDHITLPPMDYFNNSDFISETLLYRRYGNKKEIYKEMGYDLEEFNKKQMKNDMVNKYFEIKEIIDRLPNSRDIDKFSKGNTYYYGMTTYIHYFGNLSELQKYIGEYPTSIGKSISNDEIIEGLYKLRDNLGMIPTQIEINACNYLPNIKATLNKLGYDSLPDLQIALFGEKVEYACRYITEGGTKCLSTHEYTIAQILEKDDYVFLKDIRK